MTGRISLRGAGAVAVALTLAVSGVALADDASDKAQLEQRVKDLERELGEVKSTLRGGYFTANSDLEARVSELERSVADNSMAGMWKNGLYHTSSDGAFSYHWFGLIQNDWGWFWNQGNSDWNGLNPGTEFRRIRLGAEGKLYNNVSWWAELGFEHGSVTTQDMWIQLACCQMANIRIGHQKEPFGFDELTSDMFTEFMERNVVTSLSDGRNTGIEFWGHAAADDMLLWQAGMFRESDTAGDNPLQVRDGGYNLSARVSGRPMVQDDGTTWLHLGLSASRRDYPTSTASLTWMPPFASLGSALGGSSSFSADTAWKFGVEAAYVTGPWTFLGELGHYKAKGGSGASDVRADAFSLEGSYWLTGENTQYNKDKGSFARTSPKHNFGDGDGTGAWQVALRYEHAKSDAGSGGGSDDKLNTWTLGVNWWLNPQTRVTANVIHTRPDPASGSQPDWLNIIALRFQVDF